MIPSKIGKSSHRVGRVIYNIYNLKICILRICKVLQINKKTDNTIRKNGKGNWIITLMKRCLSDDEHKEKFSALLAIREM